MISPVLLSGIWGSEDFEVVQGVFDRVSSERWFTLEAERRDEFARYVLRMY